MRSTSAVVSSIQRVIAVAVRGAEQQQLEDENAECALEEVAGIFARHWLPLARVWVSVRVGRLPVKAMGAAPIDHIDAWRRLPLTVRQRGGKRSRHSAIDW